ncbi:MAG TPA: hypothetical protein VGM82_03520 [Gemmatimonadaceae bacterium]|jgi:hypothetical protein
MTTATLASTSTAPNGETRESRRQRAERMFEWLSTLGSEEYFSVVKAARSGDPPAGVLVRVYRQRFPGDAADAALTRLTNRRDPPGYLNRVVANARRRRRRLGAYTPDDLIANTIGEIITTIRTSEGKIAESAWALYLLSCTEHAYRALVGRGGTRLGSHAAAQAEADEDAMSDAQAATAWRARIEPSHFEWLEDFIARTMAEIADDDIRAIGFDLFSVHPTQVSSADPKDPNTLTGRFGVSRKTIYRWQDAARSVLYDALDEQNEHDIDLSFLVFSP